MTVFRNPSRFDMAPSVCGSFYIDIIKPL